MPLREQILELNSEQENLARTGVSDSSDVATIVVAGDLNPPGAVVLNNAYSVPDGVKLEFTLPTKNADGTNCVDLRWAKIHWGTSTGVYTGNAVIAARAGTNAIYIDTNIGTATEKFYAVTAIDSSGNESIESNEKSGTGGGAEPSTSIPDDADTYVFDTTYDSDGIGVGDGIIGIVFQIPNSGWLNFDRYRLWYDVNTGGGFPDSWTEIEPINRTAYLHKGLTTTYYYKYRASVVAKDGTESTYYDYAINGGTGFMPNIANNDIFDGTVLVGNLVSANEVRGEHFFAESYLRIGTNSWQGNGIQLEYNAGEPRAYIGDGGSNYLKYTFVGATGVLEISGKINATSGTTYDNILQAQYTADGKIIGFYQDAEPGSGMVYGDIWIDTNGAMPLDTTCIYRYEDATGGYTTGAMSWVNEPSSAVGLVYLNAATAQSTADGKVTTFYQDAEPGSGMSEGDWWVDTNDSNKTYVYSGAAWVASSSVDALQALSDAADAQSTADGKIITFFQDASPTAEGIGDLWFDTNDDNKCYRWSGAAWVISRDDGIAEAISDASDAQSTADGKITTFYQDASPTAEGIGDLWVDTNDANKLYRWSGAAWVVIPVEAGALGTTIISGGKIITGLLTASNITTGTLDASNVTITNLDADNITTGTLNASSITVTNLNASNISSGSMANSYIAWSGSVNFGNQSIYNMNVLYGGSFGSSYHWMNLDTDQWKGGAATSYLSMPSSGTSLYSAAFIRVESTGSYVYIKADTALDLVSYNHMTLEADFGQIILKNLPSSDPGVDGALYRYGTVYLRISAG